jgi:hypothetical protein
MTKTVIPAVMLGFSILFGCYDSHAQQSKIVREVQAAGGGNLDFSTLQGLAIFFSDRPQLATKINDECAHLTGQDAHWAETAEGRTCAAAHALLPAPIYTGDKRAF